VSGVELFAPATTLIPKEIPERNPHWNSHGCRSKQFDSAHRDAPATAKGRSILEIPPKCLTKFHRGIPIGTLMVAGANSSTNAHRGAPATAKGRSILETPETTEIPARKLGFFTEKPIFAPLIDPWCNGNTPVFGTVIQGSSPCGSTKFFVKKLIVKG